MHCGGVLGKVINQDHLFEEFTKWIAYKHPIVRSMDFIMGSLVGYLFVVNQDSIIKDDKNINIKSLLAVMLSIIAVFLFIYIRKEYGLDSMDSAERWWTYCVIFIPGSLLITWIIAKGEGCLVKLIQNRFLVYCGTISSVAFLLHTVVINYISRIVNWGINHVGIGVPDFIITGLLIPINFGLTIIAVRIWACIEHKWRP